MPTGPEHRRTTEVELDDRGTEMRRYTVPCRCMRGSDHDDDEVALSEYQGDDEDVDGLDVHDASDIWLSSGMDEDYAFGYSDDELRRAGGS